jgi:hypothetical protein
METKKNKYILFLFDKHEKQDEFVSEIAQEISILTDDTNISFYYGPEASVYTFSSVDDLPTVTEFVEIILSIFNATYFLLPYTNDNLSFGLEKDVAEHLFGDSKPDKMTEFDNEIKNLNDFGNIMPNFNSEMMEMFGEEEDEIKKIIRMNNKKSLQPSMDEILEKISDKGYSSLTKKELDLLNQYSKQLN